MAALRSVELGAHRGSLDWVSIGARPIRRCYEGNTRRPQRSARKRKEAKVRKSVLAFFIAGALFLALVGGVALAGKPNNQACVGHDVSGLAQALGAGFGQFVSGGASTTQGLGDDVQAHLAGKIPDEVLPNTCND